MAFDFALQLTGTVGKLESEVKNNIGAVLPGIATALKPTSGKGIVALIQLSAGIFGNCPEHAIDIDAKSSERSLIGMGVSKMLSDPEDWTPESEDEESPVYMDMLGS